MADGESSTSTPSKETSTPSPKQERVVIPVDGGGMISLDHFQRATGTEIKDEPEEETEEESHSEFDFPDSEETPSSEESETESEDEDESPEEEVDSEIKVPEAKGKGIKALDASGKEFNLPEDLVIQWKVDGELQNINLKEHLGIVAGELTVNQRLGKIASYEEQVKQTAKKARDRDAKILTQLSENKPEEAMCYLAELQGISPVQMFRTFASNIANWATKFEGMSKEQTDAWFIQQENKWLQGKEKERMDTVKKQETANQFLERTTEFYKSHGLTEDEFVKMTERLVADNALKGTTPEARATEVVQHALYAKHYSMVETAIAKVDKKLLTNRALINQVLKVTNPKEYTEKDFVAIIKEVIGSKTRQLSTSLSRKVAKTGDIPQSFSPEKKSDGKQKRTFRSLTDMQKAFGL